MESHDREAERVMHSVDVTPETKRSVMEGQVMFSIKDNKKAPETVSVQDEHLQTVVSSADGAKVLKDLDIIIQEYDKNKRPNTFLGDLAKVLGAKEDGLPYFVNDETGNKFFVSNGDARHTMMYHNINQIKVIDIYDKIIKKARFVEDLDVDTTESDTTKEISKYECPVIIDNKLYIADMTAKKYGVGQYVLDEVHLYDTKLKDDDSAPSSSTKNGIPDFNSQSSSSFGKDSVRNSNTQVDDKNARFKVVYHGSASDFAKFDHTFMGSRVDARMAEISQHFDGVELSEIQRAIVDVFGGKENNLPISVLTQDGNTHRVMLRQGREDKAGAKHSLFRHYGTNNGAYTADELLLIEDVLKNGERTEEQRRGQTVNVYKHSVDGVEYTVLTENKLNREEFANFYTNRSGNALTSNTQLSARDDSMTASEGKDTANSSYVQEGKTRFRISNENQRIFVSNAEHAVENIRQDKATPQQWKAMIEKQKE